MEKFDPAMENRVWQRVNAQPGQRSDDLRRLLLLAHEAAGDYRFLMNHLKGPAADRAGRLYEGARETLACLKGMQLLRGFPVRKLNPLPENHKEVRRVLELSYHRCRRMAAEYTARSAEPEWGMVFQSLAQREQEGCVMIAGLLGSL